MFGWGGLELYTSIKSCFTRGCRPTGTPSARRWVVEIAEHIRLTEQSCKPSWNSDVMKSKNSYVPQEMGSVFLLWHQLLHCFHLDWYAMLVPLLHPASNNCKFFWNSCCCMLLLEILQAASLNLLKSTNGCILPLECVSMFFWSGRSREVLSLIPSALGTMHARWFYHKDVTSMIVLHSFLTFRRHLPIKVKEERHIHLGLPRWCGRHWSS